MENFHEINLKKIKSQITTLRKLVTVFNEYKQKVPNQLLIETLIRVEPQNRQELQSKGAKIDNKYEDILKNMMKGKSFDLLDRINKIESSLSEYYGNPQVDQCINQESQVDTIKTKKIKKSKNAFKINKSSKNEKSQFLYTPQFENEQQIYEQSFQEYKVIQN